MPHSDPPSEEEVHALATLLNKLDEVSPVTIDELLFNAVFQRMEDEAIIAELPRRWVLECIDEARARLPEEE